jgi:hypothetical protein
MVCRNSRYSISFERFLVQYTPGSSTSKKVALRVLSSLATSAPVERSLSIARVVCGEYHMATAQETINVRVMIQVNWDLAEPLVKEALEMPHHIRTETHSFNNCHPLTKHRIPNLRERRTIGKTVFDHLPTEPARECQRQCLLSRLSPNFSLSGADHLHRFPRRQRTKSPTVQRILADVQTKKRHSVGRVNNRPTVRPDV